MSEIDLLAERPTLPVFDDIVRRSDLPTMTQYRWLKGPLPRPFRWLLLNPDAARALAEAAERIAAERQAA
jgi:hypothetical protein